MGPAVAGEIRGTLSIKSEVPARKVGTRTVRSGYKQSELPSLNDKGGLPPGTTVNEVENVVVFLEAAPGTLKATPNAKTDQAPVMNQRNKQFDPHILTVVRGSKVKFTNYDRIYHHIYSSSTPGAFEIPRYKGKHAVETFDAPGVVEIFCGIHPRMNAYIFVAENDYFRLPDARGSYRIPDVPPGVYTLKAWHPRLEMVEKEVTVPKSGAVEVDLSL